MGLRARLTFGQDLRCWGWGWLFGGMVKLLRVKVFMHVNNYLSLEEELTHLPSFPCLVLQKVSHHPHHPHHLHHPHHPHHHHQHLHHNNDPDQKGRFGNEHTFMNLWEVSYIHRAYGSMLLFIVGATQLTSPSLSPTARGTGGGIAGGTVRGTVCCMSPWYHCSAHTRRTSKNSRKVTWQQNSWQLGNILRVFQ